MRLTNITCIEGPNEWSAIYDKLTVLDLQVKSDEIDEKEMSLLFNELETHFPALIDYESGGLKKSPVSGSRGALLSLVIELVALELQSIVGMESMFSDTEELEAECSYRIVFSCNNTHEGMFAGKAAVDIVHALINHTPFDLTSILQEMITLHHTPPVQKAEAA